jgi:hypothetical protein
MSFTALDAGTLKTIGDKLERLSKSFALGYQGTQSAGKTGVAALAAEQLDATMRSITLEDKDFILMKDIPTLKANSSVYLYNVKTQVRSGVDLAGFEAFLPQEDNAQYMRVAEVLKVYGIRKSITQMAMLANEAGGFSLDIEKENDLNAALALSEQMERDLYVGGDYYNDANGGIDATIASNPNGPVRSMRGVQANVREGDQSQRGIPGDFKGYGSNRSVVFDRQGLVLDRAFLDKVVTAVRDSRGAVAEAHCTTSQLAEFRATFFPFERGDLGALYAIRGANITNDEQQALPIQTVGGVINFTPTVFKYMRQRPETIVGSAGTPPATPSASAAAAAAGSDSKLKSGEKYRYVVQAVNIAGMSSPSAGSEVTVPADGRAIEITITNTGTAEHYAVYRTPVEASGAAGLEMFIGKVVPSRGATTKFVDKGAVVPGLDSVLFMPKDKNRAKLAVLGSLLNKLDLGIMGLAQSSVYSSYAGCVVDRPRSFAIVDNAYQQREGL